MQIARIELSGFRAFAGKQTIDLDADAVILVGPNGYGKTSLLDGILWSLSGKIPRLGGNDEHLVSIYSPSGEAHVALELLYDMVPTFRPVDSEASIQLRRRRPNVEAVRNFHIVSQSI